MLKAFTEITLDRKVKTINHFSMTSSTSKQNLQNPVTLGLWLFDLSIQLSFEERLAFHHCF